MSLLTKSWKGSKKMSKLALTGIAALVILLLGAGAVFAQGGPSGYGMMNTTGTQGTQATPGEGTYGPGMMGDGNGNTNGYGMMGNANWDEMRNAMNNGDWDAMRDAVGNENWDAMQNAMNNGDWEAMHNVCQDTINNSQGTDDSQTTPQTYAPTTSNNGATSTSTSSGTTSRTRGGMMGSSI